MADSSVSWLIFALVACTIGGLAVWLALDARRPNYGLIVDKREAPCNLAMTGHKSRASLVMSDFRTEVVMRYQLKLEQAGEKARWVDVTRQQYESATVGTYWPS